MAIRWNSYHQHYQQLESQLKDIATEHNRLFVLLRETDKSIDANRVQQKQQQQQLDGAQEDFYHIVAEVSRLQQTIKHNESSHEETIIEIDRLQQQAEHLNNEYAQDTLQLEEIKQTLQEAEEQQQVVDEQLAESF